MRERPPEDLEVFIYDQWGAKLWRDLGNATQRKIIELHTRFGWAKWSAAIEYCAEREARNYRYLQAILDPSAPKATREEKQGFDQISALKKLRENSEKKANPDGR